ncbi:fumarylacetoacetate hydrolase family protein [Microbacterium sp. NPDC058062]|uniref:fumarylacetoacetate hydrolase family protein n=1 Tax=Microbacterium sp. NPDC058062 TaxID=3346320 RepID=UPI0036DE3FA0
MKIARWIYDGVREDGFVDGEALIPFADGAQVKDLLDAGLSATLEIEDRSRVASAPRAAADLRLLPPLEPPSVRDFAVFEQHVEGMVRGNSGVREADVPDAFYEQPVFYFTNPHSIIGDRDVVRRPAGTERLDFELELAAVIGAVPESAGRDLDVATAASHIFGYTIMNDWSARDLQSREMRMSLGPCKGKDFATTLGPVLVTADELSDFIDPDGFLDLTGSVSVNGEILGTDTFANMSWSFPALVAFASRDSWVKPGDVLGSGTMGNGCLAEAWGRRGLVDPPPLADGDIVTLSIEHLGALTNTVTPSVAVPPLMPGARDRRGWRRRTAAAG